jgi:glycosyltransferase involved in cell wall biosynthesis
LLHPSERETFGIVLAEAMALGLPVIATRCGGPESFVTKEVGVLVEPNNLAALSTAILQMTKEITFWRSRKNDIAEYSKARFHEKVISNQIQQCYKQIISKSYSTQTKR